ncbi:hypothetical protein CAEBREN_10848 [Caenorhabditis brenneri]|uniref:Uncharacterized protein n=1 Tax=Caenorhabditis brenneri TaxID=135651 RepID=G0MA55_CAEBE|nr:hypothetical protein CAEBREN_10848 [Caenorhabditis brenneri]
MVVYLDLTEEIIDSFNKCVKSFLFQGDYKPFFKDNQKFLDKLSDNLKYVEFEKDTKYFWISKDFKFCLKYLSKFDPRNPNETISGVGKLEKNVPDVVRDVKDGIRRKDWNYFYQKYRPDADYMISEAKKQEIIEFVISYGSGGFETFESRDEIFGYRNEEVVPLPPQINVHSKEFKNSGTMVQHVIEPQTLKKSTSHIATGTGGGIKLTPIEHNHGHNVNLGSSNSTEPVGTGLRRSDRQAAQNTVPQTIPEPSKKESEKRTFFGFIKKKPKKTVNQIESNLPKQQDYEGVNLTTYKELETRDFHLPNLPKEDPIVQLRQASLNRDSPDLDNSAFEQQLFEQKLRNSRHLEEVRAERRRKQAEFEKDLQNMRAESKKRFEILLACILMKHRFEEQEQNWKDWIQGCKNHIVDLCNRFADFEDDVHRNHGGLRKPEKVDQEDFQSDKGHLLGKIMMTFNAIQFDFEHLKSIEEKYPDALFVKVLQNCLVKAAYTLLGIYTSLQDLGVDKHEFQQLHDQVAKLTPSMIYSTTDLHRICSGDTSGKFESIEFPDLPQFVTVQEVE